MRGFACVLAIMAGSSAADEVWAPMTGPDIAAALTDRNLDYGTEKQSFRASGRTLYRQGGRESWGYWAVRGDQYCSQWPPADGWTCYDMVRSGDQLGFVGAGGDRTVGVYAD